MEPELNSASLKVLLSSISEKEKEIQRDKEAIQRVLSLMGKTKPAVTTPQGEPLTLKPLDDTNTSISSITRKSVGVLPSIFTSRDVFNQIQKDFPSMDVQKKRASISTCLIIMSEKGELKVVQKGIGTRPTKYEKV